MRLKALMLAGLVLAVVALPIGCGPNVEAPNVEATGVEATGVEATSAEATSAEATSVEAPSGSLLPQEPPQTEQDQPLEARETESPPADPLKLQDDAIEALESGDLDSAFRLVREARSISPDDPQTIFLMARVLAERNRFAEAIKMLDDLAETHAEARLPVLGQTAEWSVVQGQWQQAEDRCRALLKQVPDASMVHRMLSQLLIRQGRRLEAASYLRELCCVGDIEEFELRSLLITVSPFADQPVDEELEWIGPLGHARYEISQGNWEAALEELDRWSSERPTAEAALRGRIYAQQKDFDSLSRWASDHPTPKQEEATADYWYAIGVNDAHQGDHRAAVKSLCAAVRLDQTDAEAYSMLSRSLLELKLDEEAQEVTKRVKLIRQTQEIGNQMAAKNDRDIQAIATLSELLDELQRPFEALAWRAVHAVYGGSGSSEQAVMQALEEINRDRKQLLTADNAVASDQFIVCGVDLDSL